MAPRAAWKVLGLAPGSAVGAIRRAYADRLRAMDPDADPAAFDRLREAREIALAVARRTAEAPSPAEREDESGDEPIVPLPAGIFAAPILDAADVVGGLAVAPPHASKPQLPTSASGEAPGGPALDAALPAATLTAAAIDAAPAAGTIAVPAPDAGDVADAAYERIIALLLPDGEQSDLTLDADEQAALDAALAIVVADPRLEELGFRDRAEQWFAAVLADAIPRSDGIVHRIVDLFGWRERAGRIGEVSAVEHVVDRARILTFVTAVQNPGHRFHKEWQELTGALPERRFAPWRASRSAQRTLLQHIRGKLPGLEAWLDPDRVAKLDNQVAGPGVPYWAMGLIAAALLRLCSGLAPDTEPAGGNVSVPVMAAGESEPLRTRDRDLDVALLDIADGFTAVTVRDRNPTLFRALDRLWQDAEARGERIEPFRRAVATYLQGQLRRAIRQASYDDIAAYRRLDRITLGKLAQLDPDQCATAGSTDPALTLTDAEGQQKRALHARMLLAVTPGGTPPDRYTFRIPGDAMAAIGDATRLPRPALNKALNNEGDPETICRTRIALIDAALALPRQRGLALLRDL